MSALSARSAIRPSRAFASAVAATSSRLPYFVPRNSQGSLPVYTDIRNGGTRYLISIRNVDGNAQALADDLTQELFVPGSPEIERLKVHTIRSKHLILSGGRWKNDVLEFLKAKGF